MTIDSDRAFPLPFKYNDEVQQGMLLRDWFAGQALGSFLSQVIREDGDEYKSKTMAGDAYELADAMMKERKK